MFGFGGDEGGEEIDLAEYRRKYDALDKVYQGLYDERMPILQEYEKNAQTQLAELIGATAPQAKELFKRANNLMDASDKQIESALGYDTAERRTAERGKAMTDVGVAADAARQQALDRLESYGIDPSQTRSAGLDSGLQLAKTLQQAQAATTAETGVEQRGREYVSQAIQGGTSALGAATGASATGTQMLGNNVSAINSTANQYGEIFGTPMSNLAARSNLNTLKMQAKVAEYSNMGAGGEGDSLAGLGSLAGMAAGAYLGSAGGPLGMAAGAQVGGALGGAAGGQVTY